MCIESRRKQQDVLRHYLSKHGYRVVLLSDVERGLVRIGSNPPDCVLLMGDAVGDDLERAYGEVIAKNGPVAVAVLSELQRDLAGTLKQTPLARVLTQPLRLRDLRETISAALGERNGRGDS
jgi:serine/threonine-protein kinase